MDYPDDPRACVYFLQMVGGPIKIGTTVDIERRKKRIEARKGPLVLLATLPGGDSVERQMHQRFAHCQIQGEWFSPVEDLLGFISQI